MNRQARRRLIATADERGVLVTMAAKFRSARDVHRAARILAIGRDRRAVRCSRTSSRPASPMGGRWNADPAVSGGGVLIDNGTALRRHRPLLPRARSPRCTRSRAGASRASPSRTPRRCSCAPTTASTGTVDLSWSIDKSSTDFMASTARKARSRSAGGSRASAGRTAPTGCTFGTGYDKASARCAARCATSVSAVRGLAPPVRDHADDAIAAATASMRPTSRLRRGRWMRVRAGRARGLTAWNRRSSPPDGRDRGRRRDRRRHLGLGARARPGPRHRIGTDCIVGEKTYIAYGVTVGDRVKLNALVYVCTAVTHRGRRHDLRPARSSPTTATRGARRPTSPSCAPPIPTSTRCATIVRAGATIGARAHDRSAASRSAGSSMVGHGRRPSPASVPAFHLVVGHPARTVAIVCRCGEPFLRFATGAAPMSPTWTAASAAPLRRLVRPGDRARSERRWRGVWPERPGAEGAKSGRCGSVSRRATGPIA